MTNERLDLDKTLWDQSTFAGSSLSSLNGCFVDLEMSQLVPPEKKSSMPRSSTSRPFIRTLTIYKMSLVPGGMAVTGAMLQFYKTTTAVVFWQWVNQSFNALVNYTNRNANSPVTTNQLGAAYVSATAAAMITAIGCKSFWEKRANPLMARYVPFAAVAAANCANIPLMRQNEIRNGIEVTDENGRKLSKSKIAAAKGISQVVISRIIMCAPGMCQNNPCDVDASHAFIWKEIIFNMILPPIMERLEKYAWMQRIKILHAPIQVMMVGCFFIGKLRNEEDVCTITDKFFSLTFMVPTACASIAVSTLQRWEPENYELLLKNCEGKDIPMHLYFNKGL
ncbi:sideroflexin-2 [Vespula squamosa]|uniref:Sideroflexin-2 n=1 Tax=Vespula squamosa TaxID=30214 RepID=A0ABD2AL31_VESSQ